MSVRLLDTNLRCSDTRNGSSGMYDRREEGKSFPPALPSTSKTTGGLHQPRHDNTKSDPEMESTSHRSLRSRFDLPVLQ